MHGEIDFPLGLVFPESIKIQGSNLESTALPIGRSGEDSATGKQVGEGKPESKSHGKQSIKPRIQETHPNREWYCNAEFDLTLNPDPKAIPKELPNRLQVMARHMAWHFWPALNPKDTLRVMQPPDSEYLAYLTGLGLCPPVFQLASDPVKAFTPFGWNSEAIALNQSYIQPSHHPESTVITRVNSRLFSLELEEELFPEQAVLGRKAVFVHNKEDLIAWLKAKHTGRWVAKGNFSHGGIAQHRFELSNPMPEDLIQRLVRLQNEHLGLAMEPEQVIVVEFGVLFRIGFSGTISSPRCHRLISRTGGGYAGALVLPADGALEKWRNDIEKAVTAIGTRLVREGYFGPVGVDMYVWQDGNETRFRTLVDLNARCSMAFPVHGLAQRFPHRAVWLAQVSTRTLHIPATHLDCQRQLGPLHFDAQKKRGAFWTTPLIPGMRRHGLAFIGNDEEDIRNLHAQVSKVLIRERKQG